MSQSSLYAKIRSFMWPVLLCLLFYALIDLLTLGNIIQLTSQTSHKNLNIATASTGNVFKGSRVRTFTSGRLKTNNGTGSLESQWIIPKLPNKVTCRFWSVVTTIFEPSAAVRDQTKLQPDWCLVIMADLQSQSKHHYQGQLGVNHSQPLVFYLDPDDQREIARSVKFVQNAPWNSFARKNVGYLYALMHGAEAIWDFDDNNCLLTPYGNPLQAYLDNRNLEVVEPQSSESLALNPYSVFVTQGSFAWPRGLPLTEIKNENASFDLRKGKIQLSRFKINVSEIGIVQSLANHDPDVDAIYRMTRPLPFNFVTDSKAGFLLPKKAFSPFNAQSTLIRLSSFWTLYLPITVSERVSDVWRSYIAETLAQDLKGQRVIYTAPLVKQVRNAHNYLADFQAELDLYLKTNSLLELLRDWKPSSDNLSDRILELYVELYERDYIQIKDVQLIHDWVHALKQLDYKFPEIMTKESIFQYELLQSEKKNCPQIWPNLELFLPSNYDHFKKEVRTFIKSLELFWPHNAGNLLLLADSESADVANMKKEFMSLTKFLNSSRVALNDPTPYYDNHGHDRQQLIMFWADNFTSADFVGFVDTDTIFTTIVDVEDIFLDGKPRIIGFYRKEKEDSFWTSVSESTNWIVGQNEVMKCMSYFPVVVKTDHLREMRSYFVRLHGSQNFDQLFQELIRRPGGYSQFNIMCNYLWLFKQNEYDWHIHESSGASKWTAPPGRVKNPHTLEGSTPEMFLPFPRVAIHAFRRNSEWQSRAMRTSVCFAIQDYSIGIAGDFKPDCTTYVQGNKYHPLFFNDFEPLPTDWTWHPHVTKADEDRKERMQYSGCFPQWSDKMVRAIFEKTTPIK